MKKSIFLIIFSFFLSFLIPKNVYAQEAQDNFGIKTKATYIISETGLTNVKEQVTITNKKDFIYTPSYSITLTNGNIKNISVTDADGLIPFTLKEKADGSREIEANFEKRVVGINKSFTFTIAFSATNFAKKNGSSWEVDIPGLTDPSSYEAYTVSLTVPQSFGSATVVKPQIENSSAKTLVFTKDQIGKSGIFILFGNAEYYKGKLTYHLENLNLFPVKTEIALPPDTNYQEVIIKNITPAPENVYTDADGNWLATYSLSPHSKKDINVTAIFKLSSQPKPITLTSQERQNYIKSTTYWEASDPSIKNAAADLVSPQDIYNFIVNKLTYNYNKVNNNNSRIGAVKTLANPAFSVCLEFTDLFVALARAKGIPARAVEGYAYTQGDKLRPASLVKDVLHAWPEYYDENLKTWVMVDPTWGNTTHGMDYFNSLDYEHIAFVVKGVSSTYPVPAGGYKTSESSRDISIEFADSSEFNKTASSEVTFDPPQFPVPWTQLFGSVKIKNTGNSALNTQKMDVRSSMLNSAYAYSIPIIPPYGFREIKIDLGTLVPSVSGFLTKSHGAVTISYNASSHTFNFSLGLVIFAILGIIGGVLFVIITGVTIIAAKSRRLPFQK